MKELFNLRNICSVAFMMLFCLCINAQDVSIKNPSFEGSPQQGVNHRDFRVKGWTDCGKINFPSASPPDLHEGTSRDTSFWENEVRRSHGSTYLGLVVRDNESWESVSQRLETPLVANECYDFSVSLARSRTYKSASSSSKMLSNFTEPSVLRIWGSKGFCDCQSQLLAESEPINNIQWETFSFKLEPNSNYQYITIEAWYVTPNFLPYNGHVLVDNMSDMKLTNCEDEIIVEKRVAPKGPAHKKKKKPVVKKEPNKIDTIVAKPKPKEETILGLERKNLKKDQKINIEQLYFDADTSSIDVNSYEVLNEIYDFLKLNDDISVEIGGHTNNVPKHEYCDKLSSERAEAVANYLIGKGIPTKRISYKGYGKRKPIAKNTTPSGKRKNQRVEIKIISIG